jgi:hypothetical protein
MKKFIFTFGSEQLPEIKHIVNPMDIMLIVEAEAEGLAREKVFNSFIGKNFCTSYPYKKHVNEFKEKYNMFECEFNKLIAYVEAEEKRIQACNDVTKKYYELLEDKRR